MGLIEKNCWKKAKSKHYNKGGKEKAAEYYIAIKEGFKYFIVKQNKI